MLLVEAKQSTEVDRLKRAFANVLTESLGSSLLGMLIEN
jgi:hypothetical protein